MSNTSTICPWDGDNSWKRLLIPDGPERVKVGTRKGLPPREESMSYQLVGEVTAHQGEDG